MAVIGLDLDGVVYHFTRTFQRYALARYPELAEFVTDVEAEATRWDWFEDWGWCRDRFIIEMEIACASKELFWNAELYESDIPQQIQRLRKAGHKIEIITHRFTPMSHDATWNCLMRDRIYPCGITFSKDKTAVKTDYFLEDNIDNYEALRDEGVAAFLIDRPYNQGHWASRVATVEDFVNIVLEQTSA